MKVVDSRTFNISQTITMAEVTVVPGGMRELHVCVGSLHYLVNDAYIMLSPVAPYSARMDILHVSQLSVLNIHGYETDLTIHLSEGNARITVFASSANARTFDYQAGDIGEADNSPGHMVCS